MEMREIQITVNGQRHQASVPTRLTLADFLRDHLFLTGTHIGCEQGVCGACTVLLEGEAIRSCLILAVQAHSFSVDTVEGLAAAGTTHLLQAVFQRHQALQCGYCTPGMLMTALAFLRECPSPQEEQVRETFQGNLCRCTGYEGIVQAVLEAADTLKVEEQETPEGGIS